MSSMVKFMGTAALIAVLALGASLMAQPARAANPQELEQRIRLLEQSLSELKGQLKEVKSEQQQQGRVMAKAASGVVLPKWVERMKFFGDVRFRYENTSYDDFGGKSKDQRSRFRVRYRFGVKSQIHPDVELGFRLATGSDDDPTSTNQTMGNYWGEITSLGIDQVYVKYTPSFVPDRGLDFTFGKAKNPFLTSKAIWDGDVVPEGSWLKYTFNKKGTVQPYILGAWLYLKEHSTDPPDDLYAWAGQAGVKGKAGNLKYNLATSYYAWGDLGKDGQIPPNVHGNPEWTDSAGNTRLSTFAVWDVIAKGTYKLSKKASLSGWAHYLTNQNAEGPDEDKDSGWAAGAKFAYSKFSFGAWYKYVEANATPGFISDSDSGYVNKQGWILSAGYQFWKHGKVELTYFNMENIDDRIDGASNNYQTFFCDFVFKF